MVALRDLMTSDFELIYGEQSPKQALSKLTETEYKVLVNDEGVPIALVNSHDLEKVSDQDVPSLLDPAVNLPPRIVAGTASEVEDVARAWSDLLRTSDVRGTIVVGGRGIEGVVPSGDLRNYLDSDVDLDDLEERFLQLKRQSALCTSEVRCCSLRRRAFASTETA